MKKRLRLDSNSSGDEENKTLTGGEKPKDPTPPQLPTPTPTLEENTLEPDSKRARIDSLPPEVKVETKEETLKSDVAVTDLRSNSENGNNGPTETQAPETLEATEERAPNPTSPEELAENSKASPGTPPPPQLKKENGSLEKTGNTVKPKVSTSTPTNRPKTPNKSGGSGGGQPTCDVLETIMAGMSQTGLHK